MKTQDYTMKIKYFENGLALVGAILILASVTVAANTALAGDIGTLEIYYSAQK
jgi:hypothetical protein